MESTSALLGERAASSALDAALAPWKAPGPKFTLLFSGGVDSGLLAWEHRASPRARTLTVGRPGAPDLARAEASAKLLAVPWTGVAIEDGQLTDLRGRLAREFGTLIPPGRESIFVALALAIEQAPTETVLCGQGADELFLGYAHFRGLDLEGAAARARADLEQLIDVDWPASVRIAHGFGHTLVAPFLDPGFLAAASAIPLEARLPVPEPKHWFREWARHRGLPTEVAGQPKRALQFGTGVAKWLRAEDRGVRR